MVLFPACRYLGLAATSAGLPQWLRHAVARAARFRSAPKGTERSGPGRSSGKKGEPKLSQDAYEETVGRDADSNPNISTSWLRGLPVFAVVGSLLLLGSLECAVGVGVHHKQQSMAARVKQTAFTQEHKFIANVSASMRFELETMYYEEVAPNCPSDCRPSYWKCGLPTDALPHGGHGSGGHSHSSSVSAGHTSSGGSANAIDQGVRSSGGSDRTPRKQFAGIR
jgi:hypothetical protein